MVGTVLIMMTALLFGLCCYGGCIAIGAALTLGWYGRINKYGM